MTIEEFKALCKQKFICERLTCNPLNKKLISNFKALPVGSEFEKILKRRAWKEDSNSDCIYYLIKDRVTGKIALYFALQCGLIYMDPSSIFCTTNQRNLFSEIVEKDLLDPSQADSLDLVRSFYINNALVDPDVFDDIKKYAQEYIMQCKKSKKLNELHNVHNAYANEPAIELALFVRNADFINTFDSPIPLGVILFWEVVTDKILEIHEMIGSKWLYLFAADEDVKNKQVLINYYRTSLKFYSIPDGYAVIKPSSESGYPCLVQPFSDLKTNKDNIWYSYEEIIDKLTI